MSGVSSITPSGGTALTGAVVVSGSAPITVNQNAGQNSFVVGIGALGGVTNINGANGSLSLIQGTGIGIATDTGSGNITISNTSTSGGSSITGGGASVACNGDGSVTVLGGTSGTNKGDISITTGQNGTNGFGNLRITSYGEVEIDTSNVGTAGIWFNTAATQSYFDDSGSTTGNQSGIIQLTTTDTNATGITIGGGSAPTKGLWVGKDALTFNGAPVGGSSGSSITGGGATVACNNPSASGSITLTTTTGTASDITLDSVAGAGSSGVITLKGGGEVVVDTTRTAASSGAGFRVATTYTSATFDDTNASGVAGQIVFKTAYTNPASVCIGGPVTTTGLYVSNTTLSYNGTLFTVTNATTAPGAGTGWVFTPTNLYLNGVQKI
jgi:hypothetical protein